MNILQTTDYGLFSFFEWNRPIDPKHVEKLVQSMQQNLKPFFISVTPDMKIIDGQNRFMALKQLGLPVNYCIDNSYNDMDMIRLNHTQKSWTNYDYSNYWDKKYEGTDNNNYKIFNEFITQYKCSHTVGLHILCYPNTNDLHNKFKSGEMIIKDFTESIRIVQELLLIENLFEKALQKKSFVVAYLTCRKKAVFNFDNFFKKLSKFPHQLKNQVSISKFIENIEEIYNYRNKKQINLRYGSAKLIDEN